jgi:chemotaxis regulatin CheY-phosphate phosphatase CheZ
MRSNFVRLTLVLMIMALPALPGPLEVRIGTLLVCLSCSIALGVRWFLQVDEVSSQPEIDTPPAPDVPAGQGETVHRLSRQLREVVQQTEDAALEINARVINIIGRARAQLQAVTDVVNGLSREGDGGFAGLRQDLGPMIESMAAETASLSNDVNSVILSLQFQDLTKQRLEHVIEELQRLHGELELLRVHQEGTRTASRRASMPAVPTGQLEGPRTQGRNDG